jgi:hypothetical protein
MRVILDFILTFEMRDKTWKTTDPENYEEA